MRQGKADLIAVGPHTYDQAKLMSVIDGEYWSRLGWKHIWKRWKYMKVISQGFWMFLAGATTAVHGANSSRCECSTHGYTTCSICPAANEVGSVTELWAKLNRTMRGVLWRLLSIIWLSDIICILSAYYLHIICIFAQKCDIHGKEFNNLKSTCVIRLSTSNCT